MATVFIPRDRLRKQWRVNRPNSSKYIGDLDVRYTFNMDFENAQGNAGLGYVATRTTDSDNITGGVGKVLKFIRTNADSTDRWWGLTGSAMLKTTGTVPTAAFALDGLTGSPTDASDMEIHESNAGEDRLVVTRDSDVAILNHSDTDANIWIASWWDTNLAQAPLNTSVEHPIARLERLLIIGDKNVIHTIDQNDVVVNSALTFDPWYECRLIYISRKKVWMAFTHSRGGKALIAEWDGFSEKVRNQYEIAGNIPMSGWIYKDLPFFIDNFGVFYEWNGNTFEPFQEFPFAKDGRFFSGSNDVIQPYGCVVDGHIVKIFAQPPSSSWESRTGVWNLNMRNMNLYHTTSMGDSDADFGQGYANGPGGIVKTNFNSQAARFLIGGSIYDVYTGTTQTGVWDLRPPTNTTADTRAFFVTGRIPTEQVGEIYGSLWVLFNRFKLSGNEIRVKYRTSERFNRLLGPDEGHPGGTGTVAQITITWASTTTFTGAVPVDVAVGDEVEILSGDNAGSTFHISGLSATPDGSATITVTIEEATNFSSTSAALARFDNWRRLEFGDSDSITDSDATARLGTLPGAAADTTSTTEINRGTFVEFKVELRGALQELEELIVKSTESEGL